MEIYLLFDQEMKSMSRKEGGMGEYSASSFSLSSLLSFGEMKESN